MHLHATGILMDRTTKQFLYFIFGLSLFRLIYIYFLPITPQEAYYWYYAQYPDWSYFDHPPMAAYSIWLGTFLFGDTVFGVKFMAVVWSLLINLLLFLTTKDALPTKDEQGSRLAFTVVIVYNLTIFAHLYAMLIVPDTPLMFFWLAAIFFFQRALQDKGNYYWILSGLAMGLGLLSKYTIVALLPAFLLILLIFPEQRRWFKSVWPYLGLLVTLLVFWQVIYWNQQHDWASLSFQFSDRAAKAKRFRTKYILQLAASQFALLTPLLFFWFFRLSVKSKEIWQKNRTALFFLISGAFLIGGFILISLRTQVKMNWLLPGYLGIIIALVEFYYSKINRRSIWLKTGIWFSVALVVILHLVQLIPNIPLGEGNTWSGWQDAAQKIHTLQQEKNGRENCFIFTNSYKSASLLKFYLPDHQDTYAQNIYNRPALQFDIWGIAENLNGKDALYIFSDRKEYKKDLKYIRPFFDSIELIQTFEYSFAGKYHTRTIYCYYAQNYRDTL